MTAGGMLGGLGPRERRWLLGFLVLGSLYFAVLLLQLAFTFLAGFSQIILIVFLAWLLAFVMSPIARFLEERLPLSRPLAVVIAYLLALVGLGFVMFVAGGAITGEVGQHHQRVPADVGPDRGHAGWLRERAGAGSQVTLVELFKRPRRRWGAWPGRSSTRPR